MRLVERHNGDIVFNFDRDVTVVEIISPDLTDDELNVFLKAPRSITVILLSSPNISDDGLKHLRQLRRNGIEKLTLDSDRITDAGLRHVGGVNPQNLILHSKNVDGSGLSHLERAKGLDGLALHCPSLKEEHLKHLRRMSLSWINLAGTQITDQGVKQIIAMPLRHLNLAGTRITDDGLSQLHSMESLRELSVSGTQVTRAGIERLKRALPMMDFYETELPVQPARYTNDILAEQAQKDREQKRLEKQDQQPIKPDLRDPLRML